MICPHNPDTEAYFLWMEMLDAMIEEDQDKEFRYDQAMVLIDTGLWVQRDGKTIPIKEMTGSHIRNSIAMINRNFAKYDDLTAEIAEAWRSALEDELKRRYPPVDPALAWG